jgi:colicin import membrane protein
MDALKRFYSKHPVWSWVIIVLVGLTVLGAALPSEDGEDNGDDGSEAQAERAADEKPAEKNPEVTLDVNAPTAVRKPTAVVKGTVTPADARVWLAHPIETNQPDAKVVDGRFRVRVKLARGDNAAIVYAESAAGAEAEEQVEITRIESAAERRARIARAKARRAARAEARAEARARAEAENAIATAQDYLDTGGFSRSGLIEQLEFEGYPTGQATYAADNVGADWKAEAVQSAQDYLDTSSFSQQALIDQLTFEGFTPEEAQYGVSKAY